MSFVGVVIACWLALAAIAFVALSALARGAARGDTEANLGIIGNAELRMLLGEPDEHLLPLAARPGRLGGPRAYRLDGPRRPAPRTAYPTAGHDMLAGGRDMLTGGRPSALERVEASYTR